MNNRDIKLLVIDVDGTMTDGGIYYDSHGNEMKKFCTKDAAGFFAASAADIEIMVLTGRESKATEKRMKELKVTYLYQGIRNKSAFLKDFISGKNWNKENIGYIGDDLNDLSVMKMAGFIGCPCDACPEVIHISDYVSTQKGGHGAVRDIICFLLKSQGIWEKCIEEVYGFGT